MPLPPLPSRADQIAWQLDKSSGPATEVIAWWCIHSRTGPHLGTAGQIERWTADVWRGLPRVEREAIASKMIAIKSQANMRKGYAEMATYNLYGFGGWVVSPKRYPTCACRVIDVAQRGPNKAVPAIPHEWITTIRQCPDHAVHTTGPALYRAVEAEAERVSRTRQIVATVLGLTQGELADALTDRGITVTLEGASGVEGRQVVLDGLTGGERSQSVAALDLEFGPGLIDVR